MAWQEGAGSALIMYVGAMEAARVMIPEADAEEALVMLEVNESHDESMAEEDVESSELIKVMLGATNVAMNPTEAGISLSFSYFMGSGSDDESGQSVKYRECRTALELTTEETEQGWFSCPKCKHIIHLLVLSCCPNCHRDLESDDREITQRYYQRYACAAVVQLQSSLCGRT